MPSKKYDIDLNMGQSNEASCWYAAYCMLFKWKGLPVKYVRERIEAAGLDYTDYWNNGLPDTHYVKTRQALGLSGFSRSYFRNFANDLDHMAEILISYGPFWVAMRNPHASGDHAVIVNGVEPALNRIWVANPWGDGGRAEQTYYTAIGFKNRMNARDVFSGAQMFL